MRIIPGVMLVMAIGIGVTAVAEASVPPRLRVGDSTQVHLIVDSPKSVRAIYAEIARLSGITIYFDQRFQDSRITVDIDADSATEAFDVVATAAGHFWTPIDSSSIVIAQDTPQNRRDMEPLVVQVFPLKYAAVKDVDRLLRALIEVRRLASVETIGTIVVRETTTKMPIVEHLIHLIDRSPGQVDFSLDVIAYRDSAQRPEAPIRMALNLYRDQRTKGSVKVLVQGGLSVLNGWTGSLSMMVPVPDTADEKLTVDLSICSARVDEVATATVEAVLGFGADEILKASTEISQGETWLLPWFRADRSADLAIAITVHAVESPGFSPDDLAEYWVGTESRIGVPHS